MTIDSLNWLVWAFWYVTVTGIAVGALMLVAMAGVLTVALVEVARDHFRDARRRRALSRQPVQL